MDQELVTDPRPGAPRRFRRRPCSTVAEDVVQYSMKLEKLSLAYLVDAWGSFRSCSWSSKWPRLESLALTSQILSQTKSHQTMTLIESLLLAAARAALVMPKLKTMVLWNGQVKNACAFIYRVGTDPGPMASITWRGTWEMELGDELVEQWEEVAVKHGCVTPLRCFTTGWVVITPWILSPFSRIWEMGGRGLIVHRFFILLSGSDVLSSLHRVLYEATSQKLTAVSLWTSSHLKGCT